MCSLMDSPKWNQEIYESEKSVQLVSINMGLPSRCDFDNGYTNRVPAQASKSSSKPDVVDSSCEQCCTNRKKMYSHTSGSSTGIWTVPKKSTCDIHFSNLTYTLNTGKKEEKTLLRGINGQFLSGQLTAILGPSGAGKSTFLNILAGYKNTNITGTILVNGKSRILRKFRKHSCYIMQDDHLSAHLTVQELMVMAATLKLGSSSCTKCKKEIVADILRLLNLSDCCPQRISKLSGGQKKRMSIALELINNPPVMFFDEPTSGLDSSSCYQVISLLKLLASGGRNIMCTIHQPSARIFEKFDWLYILVQGRCMYSGKPRSLVSFLKEHELICPEYHNPADFAMEVAVGEHGDHLDYLVNSVCNGNKSLSQTDLTLKPSNDEEESLVDFGCSKSSYNVNNSTFCLLSEKERDDVDFPASFSEQLRVLFVRNFLSILRDRMLTTLRLSAHIFVSILIGMLYWQVGNDASKVVSNAGFLFFSILFLLFTSMLPTVLTFPLERTMFHREHLNYWYSLKAYYVAKTIADLPFQIVFPTLYIIVVYFTTAQPLEASRFFMFLSIGILTSLVSQSVGLLIGSAANTETAIFLGPIVSIPLLLFSGFFVTFETIPVFIRWLTYVSYVRYAYEGTMLAIYGDDRPNLECHNIFCLFTNPEDFLSELDIVDVKFSYDLVALVMIFFLLRALGYFLLRWKLAQNQ